MSQLAGGAQLVVAPVARETLPRKRRLDEPSWVKTPPTASVLVPGMTSRPNTVSLAEALNAVTRLPLTADTAAILSREAPLTCANQPPRYSTPSCCSSAKTVEDADAVNPAMAWPVPASSAATRLRFSPPIEVNAPPA